MKPRLLPCVITMAVATASATTLAEEAIYQSFDAHVHGEVTASLAQDGERVLIELTAPGHDVVGFEHQPKTPLITKRSTMPTSCCVMAKSDSNSPRRLIAT
ncbi:ZrgA family zinc uptake protein [Salinivibrio socompensis]|uniref:ZrgA family zinc uptake protein n=1 Tax=Salinivibrio socompensis TaxID=1510206 RepID=UPI000471F4EC